jgi:CelD/BcsL family acetyltransferase involved in cellulose biosynthesis
VAFYRHVANSQREGSASESGYSATRGVRVAYPSAEGTLTGQSCVIALDSPSQYAVSPVSLELRVYDSFAPLLSRRDRWDALSGGVVFRSFDWLHLWWQHYGQLDPRRQLYVVAMFETRQNRQECVAVVPWYVERSLTRGTMIRWLGSGEVCSDHLSLLVERGREAEVAEVLADHLNDDVSWDQLQLEAVDEGDLAVSELASALARRHCGIRQRKTGNCWVVDLPATWEEFLAMQSKSHRKQLRQSYDRVLTSSRTKWHQVKSHVDVVDGWSIFVDLHQRRRRSLGEPGCFASLRFGQFHREVADHLLSTGKLRLSWLELDGAPAAAEYHFASADATFAYQGGVDPARLAEEPGRLSNIATIRHAISEGHKQFDLLRGDEPYKSHWRATPRAAFRWEAVAPRPTARWRAQSFDWAAGLSSRVRGGARSLACTFTSLATKPTP